jgi:hypothetical protein
MVRKSTALSLVLLAGFATAGTAQSRSPDRQGFTMSFAAGVGLQRDEIAGETKTAGAGLDVGLGGFVNEELAILFRISGTNAKYGSLWQTSGTAGAAAQYWIGDRLRLEGGVGGGFWSYDQRRDVALGLILAAGYSIWHNATSSVSLGVEYAPAFTDPDTVHNLGFVLAWQLH